MNFKKSIMFALLGAAMCSSLISCNNDTSGGGIDDYGIDSEVFGAELMRILHYRMMDTHTTYVTYGSVNTYIKGSGKQTNLPLDSYPDSNKINLFYTGKEVSTTTSWTREHVWAAANSNDLWSHNSSTGIHYVDNSNYKGGGSDLYHIRPCGSYINTVRGNGKFMEFADSAVKDVDYYEITESGGKYITKMDKNDEYATKVEPANEYKGDIARILMYIYIHYSSTIGDNTTYSATQQSYLGSLNLRNVFNSNLSLTDVQEMLVKWNNLDPVDDMERQRNQAVELIQGNRNPFVDHPEYMARCFGIDE